ncbi:MAG: hypothetical protein PHR66_01465 [Desulfuromonadaceae bacterium]|nr:hypothetical protein [Desulfuromonadaceae bacterium]
MEEKQGSTRLRRLAADLTSDRVAPFKVNHVQPVTEDASPEVARENIVKEMMMIFNGLLGCTSKRTGVNLSLMKGGTKGDRPKPESGAQRTLEKKIYRLIKGLVELDSPNTGFALNVLYNNGTYYYDRANVPLSFGIFLGSLVEFLEGHDCLSICPDEMVKLKTLLTRG